MAGLAPAPESPVWLRWRGRGAAAELAEQRLLGPHWRETGDTGAADDGALLEDGGQVHTLPAALVLHQMQLPGSSCTQGVCDMVPCCGRRAAEAWRTGLRGDSVPTLPPSRVQGPS